MLGWKDVSDYPFQVVTLFETVQLEWMLKWKKKEVLHVMLKKYPEVSWHIKHKAPHLKKAYEEVEKLETTFQYSKELEKKFVQTLEDWIIYVTDPEAYDKQEHNLWDKEELLSIIDCENKTVIDIGSGTGVQAFRVTERAKTVFCVEPIANLRTYLKDKAKSLGINNAYVVDGLITDLPYPDNFSDVVMTGHVFGDDIEEEYKEMHRVVKPGGQIILIPGNNDVDNDIHDFLMKKGFSYASFLEPGDGMKRKYWKRK